MHENAGEHGKASEAFEVAIDYCASTGIEGTGAICSACLATCSVSAANGGGACALRDADREPGGDAGSRAIAAAVASQIHASAVSAGPRACASWKRRPSCASCAFFGAEMECSWTLARLEVLEGSTENALEHGRDLLRRWEESEDRHYSLNAWAG